MNVRIIDPSLVTKFTIGIENENMWRRQYAIRRRNLLSIAVI